MAVLFPCTQGVSIGRLIAQEFAINFATRRTRVAIACSSSRGPQDIQPDSLIAELAHRSEWELLNGPSAALSRSFNRTRPSHVT